MSNVVNGMDEPLSPDSQAYVDNYSPSNESPSLVAFFGRRRLRIINGQDPERDSGQFTPRVDLTKYKWPTDEEARNFAEKAIAASKSETKCKQALDFAANLTQKISPRPFYASGLTPILLATLVWMREALGATGLS